MSLSKPKIITSTLPASEPLAQVSGGLPIVGRAVVEGRALVRNGIAQQTRLLRLRGANSAPLRSECLCLLARE